MFEVKKTNTNVLLIFSEDLLTNSIDNQKILYENEDIEISSSRINTLFKNFNKEKFKYKNNQFCIKVSLESNNPFKTINKNEKQSIYSLINPLNKLIRPYFLKDNIRNSSLLKDYQKERVLTFFNPERDPLGNGYHIMQSKIALGSGGIFGKGYMEGTQSHLNFLPEMQTDFIFTMLGDEFGFIGTLILLFMYAALIMISIRLALKSRSLFSKYLSLGVCNVFFIYVFVNIAMVLGMLPIVGAPLPIMSYGGSSLLSIMLGLSIVMSCKIYSRDPIGN